MFDRSSGRERLPTAEVHGLERSAVQPGVVAGRSALGAEGRTQGRVDAGRRGLCLPGGHAEPPGCVGSASALFQLQAQISLFGDEEKKKPRVFFLQCLLGSDLSTKEAPPPLSF